MEPATLAGLVALLGVCTVVALSVLWWLFKSTVRMAVRLLVATTVVMGGLILAAALTAAYATY